VIMARSCQEQGRARFKFDNLKRHCHRSAVRPALQKPAVQKRIETKMMKSSKWLVYLRVTAPGRDGT
jgi:hypothetical protein